MFVKKKFKSLLLPYIIVYILPSLITKAIMKYPLIGEVGVISYLSDCSWALFFEMFHSTYWFLPVAFIYLLISYFIPNEKIVVALSVMIPVTLFYSANIYLKVLSDTSHSMAVPGFFTFFLIGRLIKLKEFTMKMPLYVVITALLLSQFETWILDGDNNSIRLSNCLYGMAVYFYLAPKLMSFRLPEYIGKLKNYFIYLFHQMYLSFFLLMARYNHIDININNVILLVVLVLGFTLLTEKIVFSFKNPLAKLF